MESSTESSDNQQPNSTRCDCKGVCSRKDGSKRKGCPCKTKGTFCTSDCHCGSRSKPCQNKGDYVRPARPEKRARTQQQQQQQPGASQTRISEFEECDREHQAVKNFISNLEERTLRSLSIRVLSRGIGSVDYIQSQLVGVEDDDERPQMVNAYGSPIRSIQVADEPSLATPASPNPSTSLHSLHETNLDTITEDPPLTYQTPVNVMHLSSEPEIRSASTDITDSTPLPNVSPMNSEQTPSESTQQQHTVPQWCRCGRCREMPKLIENVCCRVRSCVSETLRFYKLCLDPDVLSVAVLNHADIRNDPFDNSTRQFRKAAYRQFILDKHGHLGRGNRRVVPSCIVWKVRNKYPSPTGMYMGFREN